MKVQSRSDVKKIGELVCDGAMKFVDNFAVEINGERVAEYESLDAVAKDWKDYEPTEPLIKDPKSRKVFQEWADLFGAEQFRVNHFSDSRRKTTSIGSTDSVTEPVIELPGHIGEDSEIYTKEELCGEEEE